jgi:cytoskeletal protein CcmA (bactofilin family)
MPSTYTLNNGIELIGTGEQSGTWGDTTNTNLGLLDAALDGQVTVALASAGSSGSPNSLPITDGTASNGRNRMVVFSDSGDLGATAYVQLTPNDAEKIIYIRNSLSGSRSVILFQGTYNASNDYEVPAGTTAIVYFDGAGAGAVAANVFNNAYFDGLRLGSVSVTAILDEDNMASDSATALATQQSIKAYVDSQVGTVDTLAEILAIGNTTGATDIAVDSAQKVQFRDAAIYINSSVDGQLDIVADTEIQIAATTVDLNGNLDVSGTLGVTGVLTATSLDISGDIDVDGTTNLDVVDIDGAVDMASTLLVTGVLTTTAATVSNGGGQFNGAINVGVDDTGYDVKFFGATTGKSLLWDESADSLIVTGTTTLVGTTNLDAVDIDGATQIDATVTVGVDDTGYDVKFFGATAGAYMLWDESADDLILGGAAGLSVNSTALVTGVLTTTAATVSNGGGQFNGAINVGVDDTGYDVKFFGATAGKYMLWDESADTLEVSGTVVAAAGTALLPSITTTGDLNTGMWFPAADTIAFSEGGAMRIDSSGRVLIGTDSSIEVESYYRPKFQVAQAGSSDSAARGILINYGRNDTGGGAAVMYSRHSGTAVGSEGNVANNYVLGENKYTGWYSDNYYLAANIKVEVDGTPSSADMPGRIVFATTADGAASPTERMRIDSYGNVIINNGGAGNEKTLSITGTGTGTNPAATSYSGAALMLQNNYATDNAFSIIDFNNSNSLVTSRIAGVNSNISSRLGDIALLTHNGTGLTEAMRITSSQWVNLGVGTDAVSSPQTGFWNGGATGYSGILNIQNVNSSAAGNYVTIAASKVSNDSESAQLGFGKSRGTTANSRTIVADSDSIGILTFQAADGTDLVESVRIVAAVDGTPGADDMPGRLQFFTTADGASSVTERMRLDQAGNLTVGTGNYPHTDKGIAYGDGTQRYGAAIYKVQDGIASGEGLSITVRDDTGGWAGILTVMAHTDGGANNYRHKVFAVMGRNTACTFTEIGGATGGTAPGITMSCPTAGEMKATFTIASGTVAAAMNFNGGWGF